MVAQIAGQLSDREIAVVAVGTGEPVLEKFFRDWAFWHRGNVAVKITYDDALAHKIEAGLRHVPDAVEVRAMRPQPDLFAQIRNCADCARHRRPRRHH